METEEPRQASGESHDDVDIHAFLIADIRGYSTFTHERGDEDAARLADHFASITGDVVTEHRGRIVELRGDEALVVFSSPRAAIRAAVALQLRFVAETIADPSLPLTVGIGLDAGEAVRVGEGFRGAALNVAARLCSLARAGEVLASRELAHLARTVADVRFEERGPVRLKGIDRPVVVVALRSDREDSVGAMAAFVQRPPTRPRRIRRFVPAAVGFAVLITALVPILRQSEGRSTIPPNSVALLDSATANVTATVPLDGRPGAIDASDDAVWVALPDLGRVVKIDPTLASVVDTIPELQNPTALAVAGDDVWVVESGGPAVSQISSALGAVVQTVDDVGNGPSSVTVAAGSVWVASRFDGALIQIDPVQGEVVDAIPVGLDPRSVVAGFGDLWVAASGQNDVIRIDPETQRVTPIRVGSGPGALAVGEDAVWVVNTLDDTVSEIDPETDQVVATAGVGDGPSSIATIDDEVWIGSSDGTVTVLRSGDPTPGSVAVGSAPQGLAGGGDALWVAAGGTATSHHGGTLRVAAHQPPGTLDPAVAWDVFSWRVLPMTGDGLVAFREIGGIEGQALWPDLAASLHPPTDGGRTYSFRLRSGIQYSNGEPLRASDFRRAFERGFQMTPSRGIYAYFFRRVVGAGDCLSAPRTCDLSSGIDVDDAEGTVTFHLTTDDPEFLYKLALPFAYPVPPTTPASERRLVGIPGTGPYMVEGSMTSGSLTLVRNPYFREWSKEAQPDGNADRIEWLFRDARELVDLVTSGKADIAMDPGTEQVDEISVRFAGQVFTSLNQDIVYVSMRTDLPPFDKVDVRRALNLAVDRAQVADILGGEATARPTCQQIPPNFPGYQPFCPFTAKASPDGGGIWRAPDLEEARRLVQRSGTAGTRVQYWFSPGQYGCGGCERELARYIVQLLETLGFRASAEPIPSYGPLYEPENRYQMAFTYWGADYPSASTFFGPLLTCNARFNTAALCDPELDELVDRATRTLVEDPEVAQSLWEEADRMIAKRSPHLWLVNPLSVVFVSPRLGNYQLHPQWGPILSQMWVE